MLILSRYRKSKALLLSVGLLLFCFMFVAGRQAEISVKSGTGQKRVQVWKDGLVEMRQAPILGVGTGNYMTITNTVAHNSFVQAFVETGLVGGILFFGAVYYAFRTMYRLGSEEVSLIDPELRALRPYMMAVLVSYAVGMMSLTENYIVPTWVIFGMSTVFIRLSTTERPLGGTQFNGALVTRMMLSSMVFLAVLFIFVQLNCEY
jgi:O-antigen ligase